MFPQIERLLGDRIPKKTADWSLLLVLEEKKKTLYLLIWPLVLYLDNWFSSSQFNLNHAVAMFGMAYYLTTILVLLFL